MKLRIRSLLFLLFTFSFVVNSYSQNATEKKQIKGEVINRETKEPYSFAVVSLHRSADSTLVDGIVSDLNGVFNLNVPDTGHFYLKISCIGCQTRFIYPLSLDKSITQLGKLEIDPRTLLKDVEIFDERPAYQIDEEKKIYRVDKDPMSSSGSTGDILQNIPSVFVDLDGNVKLRGGNVKILIDGKPSSLMGISRKEVLEFLPANMIETVEIINNPSSKYDASGEAGIINIVLKKPKDAGLNWFFSGSIGTGDKYNGSVHVMYHTEKFTFFISDDYRSYDMHGTTIKNRQFKQNGLIHSYLDQTQEWIEHNQSNNIRASLNYSFNPKNEITASVVHKNTDGIDKAYTFYKKYDDMHVLSKAYDRQSPDSATDYANDLSLGYTRKYKKKDEFIEVNLFYAGSKENTNTSIIQKYYDLVNFVPFFADPLTESISDIGKQTRSMGQIDYQLPIHKNTKIETGLKSTYRTSDLDYTFSKYDFGTHEYFRVPEYTNHYKQSEQINAGYLSYRSKYKKYSYKIGARIEQTITNADLFFLSRVSGLDSTITKDRYYLDIFPSLHLFRRINKKNTISLTYSRRINRPGVRSLNPFYKFIDAVTVRTGNPNLKPEYTHSIELSHTKNSDAVTINSSLYYRYTSGTEQKVSFLDSIGTAVTTFQNFNSDQDIGAEVFISKQVGKIYRFNTGLNAYRSIIDGTNIDSIYKSDNYNFNIKFNNYFTLGPKWVIQLTANYVAPIVRPTFKSHAVFFSDLSLRKDFQKKKLTMSLRLSDIFFTRKQINETNNPLYYINSETQKRSRVLFFSITYRPGFSKNKNKNVQKEEDNSNDPDKSDSEDH